jgi:hypothetical protein
MSSDIHVNQHLSPKMNRHCLGNMHPACWLLAAEIMPTLSKGAFQNYGDVQGASLNFPIRSVNSTIG